MCTFAFATGIENSAPTIRGGRERVDEFEKCGFYRHWRTDFELVLELGTPFLRYGPPLHRTWLGDGRYDWEFADATFADLKAKDIVPIVDLCHFGVPDWIGNFQNGDFRKLFARYARDFAARFPWVQLTQARAPGRTRKTDASLNSLRAALKFASREAGKRS